MKEQVAIRSAAVLLATLLALSFPLAAEPEDESPGGEPTLGELEKYDQPPGDYKAREDVLARSPGLTVGVGSYVSIQVNVDELGQNIVGDAANEPSIAVNPTNPANMVVGWRQFDTINSNFRQAGWAYTFDAGQTWTFPGSLTPGTFRSDPVLDFDSQGNVYYQSLQSNFDMSVFKSANGGVTWSAPVPSFGGDKNWMVVDRSGGIGDGNNYGGWREGFGCCGANILTRSTDGAQTFESPVAIPKSPAIGTMAVGPDGAVYVSGVDHTSGTNFNAWVVGKSTNAQNPAATPTFTGVDVDMGGSMEIFGGPNPQGLMGQANIVVNQFNGNVFMLASVDPFAPGANPTDVHIVRSVDGGNTWSTPVRVNDDPGNGAWHWMAAAAVAPNGRLDAFWIDSRNGSSSNMNEIFYSYSWDQGLTWAPNVQVSPQFNSSVGWPQQSKMGDYYTLVSDETGADAIYCATFNGEQDVYYVRLFPDCNSNGQSDVIDIAHDTSEDCNANLIPDECETNLGCGAAGSTPDGRFVVGTQLTLDKAVGGQITLNWGGSCLGGSSVDYHVYEGTVGDFESHSPILCTTESQTTVEFAPAAASSYYLIVPRSDTREGSYGRESAGAERPQATAPCMPQQIGSCSWGG